MQTSRYQGGMSTSSWMIVLGLVGFFLTLLFKMGPAYLDNWNLQTALKSMATGSSDLHELDKDDIYKQISRYFTINGVRRVSPKQMKIVRKEDRTLINYVYETRVPVFLNVDVVMKFRNQVDSTNPEACCKYLIEDDQKEDSTN